jgi:hypothetical protein
VSRLIGSFRVDDSARTTSIRIADGVNDLLGIGKLRYSLYVARDGKAYPCANRANGSLIEPIDSSSVNLFAVVQDSCVTAVRITRARLAVDDQYLNRLLAHSAFETSSYDSLVVVSRLVAAEHPGARALMFSAMQESYRVALRNGIQFAVAATRASLVPSFSRVGWVASGVTYKEEIAGEMHVLVLAMRDRRHFQSVGSILLNELDSFEREEVVMEPLA